jgi:hypothetical protein
MGPASDTLGSTPQRPRPRRSVVLGVAVLALLVIAIAWHLIALAEYRATSEAGTVTSRLSDARAASTLEPWNQPFRWRVVTLEGLRLLQEGQVDKAFWLLEPYSQIVRGDPLYRSVYQEVVSVKAPLDARKAHVQHAREQTGGVLLEKDVIH